MKTYREVEGRICFFQRLKLKQYCRINYTSKELFIQTCKLRLELQIGAPLDGLTDVYSHVISHFGWLYEQSATQMYADIKSRNTLYAYLDVQEFLATKQS